MGHSKSLKNWTIQ